MSEIGKATPRPWAIGQTGGNGVVIRSGAIPVAELWHNGNDPHANAALIVEAVNSFEALTAERDALKAENELLREKLEEKVEKLSGCPFARPGYELPLDVPCPVCGTLGTHDTPDNCLYPSKRSS